MTDLEVLIDLLDDLTRDIRRLIEPLSLHDLIWQPAPKSNNIGVTVWHFSRWLDLLTVRALQNLPPEEEQWHTRNWVVQTGYYDPRGIGFAGFGAITGYSWEEVQEIPALSAQELLTYFDQVTNALRDYLLVMPIAQLHQPVQGLERDHTTYEWLKSILKGCFWHTGEIQAIKAMKAQYTAAEPAS